MIDGECANGFVVAGVVWVEMGCWECEGCVVMIREGGTEARIEMYMGFPIGTKPGGPFTGGNLVVRGWQRNIWMWS